MIIAEEIKDCTDRLTHLMYGYNYQITLGIEAFDDCSTFELFFQKLKLLFPDTQPGKAELILLHEDDLNEEINFGFAYRGDEHSGLELNDSQEKELLVLQQKYRELISRCITPGTMIYSYTSEEGIPGYPVYWGYTFILLNKEGTSLLVYGSASD